MTALWLVQRLDRRASTRKGFDGIFAGQYMGSAEFEFGALPQSLNRIRESKHAGIGAAEIAGRTIYLYGSPEARAAVLDALPEWIAAGCPGKEMSYFDKHLHGAATEWQSVDMWWALREDVMFTLDPDIAADIERAVVR